MNKETSNTRKKCKSNLLAEASNNLNTRIQVSNPAFKTDVFVVVRRAECPFLGSSHHFSYTIWNVRGSRG